MHPFKQDQQNENIQYLHKNIIEHKRKLAVHFFFLYTDWKNSLERYWCKVETFQSEFLKNKAIFTSMKEE